MRYFIANFKQNFNLTELQSWISSFSPTSNPDTEIIIAGSYHHLPLLRDTRYHLAAQNISSFSNGPHTGSIGVDQLEDLITYCLIGHSETRKEFGDTNETVAKKAHLLQKSNIIPIVCLDLPYLESQLTALKHELLEIKDLLIAYEPLSAIGSGNSETPSRANEIAFKIKTLAHNKDIPVIYGGSVDSLNVPDFLNQDFIDGVLVGSASLDPYHFAKIISCD